MLNRVILIGRLTRDPEMKRTPTSGVALANFTLAVDRYFQSSKREKETDFIRIIAWGKLAETCKEYLGKGHLVAVDGRLMVRKWETPQGERRSILEVRAEEVRFLERSPSSRSRGRIADSDIPEDEEYSDAGRGNTAGSGGKWGGAPGGAGGSTGSPDPSGLGGLDPADKGSLDADPGFPGGGDEIPVEKTDSGKKDFGNVSDSQLDDEIDLDDDDPFKEDF